MKRIITLAAMLLFVSGTLVNAQEPADTVKYWKVGGDASLTFGQAALINWSAGGVSSLSINGLVNFHADYQKNKILWTNNLIMAYGMYKEKDDDRSKSDDKIDFTSNLGYEMTKNWYYSFTAGLGPNGITSDKGFFLLLRCLYFFRFFFNFHGLMFSCYFLQIIHPRQAVDDGIFTDQA